jgi:ParB family chromosome partitioning protein
MEYDEVSESDENTIVIRREPIKSKFGKNEEEPTDGAPVVEASRDVTEVETEMVFPNPNQPRKAFSEEALQELENSVRLHGIVQPIVVVERKHAMLPGKYMIVAGERRWRAAVRAGLTKIPVTLKDLTDQKIKEISLIENLQREDLNVIEAANAIRQLMDEFNFTQEQVAERLGKARPTIANTLRLLTLASEVIKMVENGSLSAGHARCLVVVNDTNDQLQLAKTAAAGKITVRELERLVREYLEPPVEKEVKHIEQSPELKDLVIKLTRTLGTKVTLIGNDNKGRIRIDYFTRDDLERIYDLLTKGKQN